MIKKILSFSIQLALFVAIYFAFDAWQTRDLLSDSGKLAAPDFELVSLDNKVYHLSKLAKVETVIYFFAPWCNVCHLSIGNLEELRKSAPQDKLNIIIIALDWQSIAELKKYKKDHGLSMPILLGGTKVMKDYRIQAFPTYYVLDENHNITKVSMGYSTELGLKFNTWG